MGVHPITRAQGSLKLTNWIDGGTRIWKEEVIRVEMLEEKSLIVMNIPIKMLTRSDELRWPFDRVGKVIAKFAYHYFRAQEEKVEDVLAATRAGPGRNLWKMIWKTNTLPKINTFAWKLAANAVAVREELARRGYKCKQPTSCATIWNLGST